MRASALALVAATALSLAAPAAAVQPDEILSDPLLEKRAREISRGLRCLVCQNQSIDDSEASLARDLRVLVRERLKAGDTDEQVLQFLTNRYGDFVLLEPPFKAATALLWIAPGSLLGVGALSLVLMVSRRRARAGADPELTDTERAELAEIARR